MYNSILVVDLSLVEARSIELAVRTAWLGFVLDLIDQSADTVRDGDCEGAAVLQRAFGLTGPADSRRRPVHIIQKDQQSTC